MTLKTFVAAKLHGIRVTDKSIQYNGSVSIDEKLMGLAGIEPYEQVDVVNLMNGARWTTYALPSMIRGAFTLNGGGARLGEVGDECVIMSYRQMERFCGAITVFLDQNNHVRDTWYYGS